MDISNLNREQLKAVKRMAYMSECRLDQWADDHEEINPGASADYREKAEEMFDLWLRCIHAMKKAA